MSINAPVEIYANTATPGVATFAVTLTANAGAGNLVTACLSPTNFTISSIADARGNTWTKVRNAQNTTDIELWWTLQTGGALLSGDTVTLTCGGTVFNFAGLIESWVSGGGWPVAPLDVSSQNAAATGTTRDGGTTAATAQAEELIVGAFSVGGGVAETSFTAGTGYTAFPTAFKNLGTSTAVMGCYKVTSSTGTQNANGTGGASQGSSGITAAFKNTAGGGGGGGTLGTLALLGVGS